MLTSLTKLILKVSLVIILFAGIGALALHIWFVNNARGVLKDIVKEKSDGRFKLELSQLTFDFFSNTLVARYADISSTDSTHQPASYHVKFNRLTLHVGSFWPLLFSKNLVLDSIKLHHPEIEVKQWRADTSFSNAELSVPQEMGRMYHSMLDVLEAFGIRRIQINNARVTLTNKMKPASLPVSISDIYMDLFKTPNETVEEGGLADHSQSIDLRTRHQRIALPGGRHTLAFKNFHLQLFRKRIQLDSCTITARTTDSTSSSYKIFFSKLMLTGVDFDVMYRQNLIRADSVYCENPLFEIQLDRTKSSASKNERPDANKIIKELTGELDLAFVGVKDAGIRIEMTGANKRSLYNSNRDDFEMHGLRINSDSSMPVSVKRFNMLVRDYYLYNEDSSAVYSFDSIHFVNNKIRLSNFSAVTGSSANVVHNKRDFKIRLFELTGLDWYELVFNETLKAQEAYLFNPVISFEKRRISRNKRLNVFTSLQTLDDFMTLDKITVLNGKLDMKLSEDISVNLDRVNFSLYSNQLLKSTDREDIRKAVDHFSFAEGLLRFKTISAYLEGVEYTGENFLHAGVVRLESRDKHMEAKLNDVYIDHLVIDDDATNILVDGLRWNGGRFVYKSPATDDDSKRNNKLVLKNLHAVNTDVSIQDGAALYNTVIDDVRFLSFSNSYVQPLQGLQIRGRDLSVKNPPLQFNAAGYVISDESVSYFSNVNGSMYSVNDSLSLRSRRVGFIISINKALKNDYHFQELNLQSPVFSFSSNVATETGTTAAREKKPVIKVDKLQISEPEIQIETRRHDSLSVITVPASGRADIKLSGFRSDSSGIYVEGLKVNTSQASFLNRFGNQVQLNEGKLNLQLSAFHFSTNGGKPSWDALIDNIQVSNPEQLLTGNKKNAVSIRQAELGNVRISSEYFSNADLFLQKNLAAWLTNTTGEYSDSVSTYKWYNAAFKSGRLSVDSFVYYPTQAKDVLTSSLPYQKDYITAQSGKIVLTGFNPEAYKRDSAIFAEIISIDNPLITVFRDKQPPFLPGIIKPLPVDMIRNITPPVMVDEINISDGMLAYTEKNAKSRQEGVITLSQMQMKLQNIRNREIGAGDSLYVSMNALLMDSARINLVIRQAYEDSLRSFLMKLRMKPTSLLFLNPVLTPLSNVKIVSGKIDSLELSAVGREYLAFGKMNMFYRNLKVQLVKDGDPDKQTLKNRALSFIVNSFVIKRNNNGRTGLVYFERLRDRSFFNYIIKMTFSGMATSIGVKKNRKYMKQYKRALKERGLQEIEIR